MKAYVITIRGNRYSESCAARCLDSVLEHTCPNLDMETHHARTPDTLRPGDLARYSYPGEGQTIEHPSGMVLEGYRCSDVQKKIACTLSHMELWKKCVMMQETIIILEHDAVFTRWFDPDAIDIDDGQIVSINDPRGATRRGFLYHRKINLAGLGPREITGVNRSDENAPDGLPGNSAYIITPGAALDAIGLVGVWGIWPNDALLCKQFFPHRLFSLYPYATKVVQHQSTTT